MLTFPGEVAGTGNSPVLQEKAETPRGLHSTWLMRNRAIWPLWEDDSH